MLARAKKRGEHGKKRARGGRRRRRQEDDDDEEEEHARGGEHWESGKTGRSH